MAERVYRSDDEYRAMIARVAENLRSEMKARVLEQIGKGRDPQEVALEIVNNICDAARGKLEV